MSRNAKPAVRKKRPNAGRSNASDRQGQDRVGGFSEAQVKLPILDPTAQFLLETLIKKQSIYRRAAVSYVTLRQWRKAIRPYQMIALTALKANPPEHFVNEIAAEMAHAIAGIAGYGLIRSVVPVPGGSSGLNPSFSNRLARAIADRLEVAFCDVLVAPVVKLGRSSPKKSSILKPYRVEGPLLAPAIVVDDVVSSGRHMELAQMALRSFDVPVLGIAWIGPS